MPSLRPFSHIPPSEIGASLRLKSVLYDLVGAFFGNSIMWLLPCCFSSLGGSDRMGGFLGRCGFALCDDFASLREPLLFSARFHHGDDRDAQREPSRRDQRRIAVRSGRQRNEGSVDGVEENEARSHPEDEGQESVELAARLRPVILHEADIR